MEATRCVQGRDGFAQGRHHGDDLSRAQVSAGVHHAAQGRTVDEVEDERGPVVGHGHDVAQGDEVLVPDGHEHVLLGAGRLLVGEPARPRAAP